MRRSLALLTLAATLVPAAAAHAQAHDIRGLVSQSGLDFLAEQVPSYVPKHLSPPDMTKSLACVDATQRDTEIDLTVDAFDIAVPRPGRLTVDVTLSASGTGELFAKDIVACLGDLTCQDSFSIEGIRAVIQLDVQLVDGQPRVGMTDVDIQLDPDALDLRFSGCLVGDLVTWVIDFAKGYVLDFIVAKIEDVARDAIAPRVEEMLLGLAYNGSVGSVKFEASLQDLVLDDASLELGAAVDINTPYPAERCIAEFDRGEPTDVAGARPDLAAGKESHLALAANFGIVNDVLYHVWRSGFMCLTDEHLAALGLHVPLDMAAELLPGFPPGTELGVEILAEKPITMGGMSDDDASLSLVIEDLNVALTGRLPDGSDKRLAVRVSATARAIIGVDRASNALVAELAGLTLQQLEFDQLTAVEYGFDVARIQTVVEDLVVPHLIDQMGKMPLTGPVFSGAGYAVILRGLSTTDAYLGVKADLFRVPTDDVDAPDTSLLGYPQGPVSPRDSVIEIGGVDARIPFELLQYIVTVDGEARPASFIRQAQIGKAGESGTYEVAVAAVDLSGNVDPTPATVSVTVDGIAPKLLLIGDRMRREEGPFDLRWTISDDLTPADQLGARLEIYKVTDPTDLLSAVLLETRVMPPGTTAATVEGLEADALYRVELKAVDAVGNESAASVLVDLRTGGCQAAGGAGGPAALLLGLGLALVTLRRRR